MTNLTNNLIAIVFFMAPFFSQAEIISLGNGNITSDTDSQLIVDHLNQREYLRLDVLGPMNYQEQVDLTITGAYSDFTIADQNISFDFIKSLLDNNTGNCLSATTTSGACHSLSTWSLWSEGDLGFSNDNNFDYWIFKNTNIDKTLDFGLAGVRNTGLVYSFSNWGNESTVNFFGQSTVVPIHMLMYRDIETTTVVTASEPATFCLMLLLFVCFLYPISFKMPDFSGN